MINLTMKRIEELNRPQSEVCVSLYCPLDRGDEARQNPIRLKNLRAQARKLLEEAGHDQARIEGWLEPVNDLLDRNPRVTGVAGSLAFFLGGSQPRTLVVPGSVPEEVRVGSSFWLAPLLEAADRSWRYLAVPISQNQVRLFFGDPYHVQQVDLPEGMPSKLEDVIVWEKSAGLNSGQLYSNRPSSSPVGSAHGRNPSDHVHEEFVSRYLRQVARGLEEMLANSQVPVVLIGVNELTTALREELDLETPILEVHGNFDHKGPEGIHSLAWERIQRLAAERQSELRQLLDETPPRLLATRIDEMAEAAEQGRIERMLVARGCHQDSVETSALETLKHSGEVSYLEPDLLATSAVAILRY
ncbi:MAG: hypothetical protein KC910_13285 [Candidatus Eremiobacteraeota bacterium]|nr:hypothetical protein [Candidatus Eremiobacteraeota bacterium]